MQPPDGELSLSRETGPVTLFYCWMRGRCLSNVGSLGWNPLWQGGAHAGVRQESPPPYKQKGRFVQSSESERADQQDCGVGALPRPLRFPCALRGRTARPLTGLLGAFFPNVLNQDFSRFPLTTHLLASVITSSGEVGQEGAPGPAVSETLSPKGSDPERDPPESPGERRREGPADTGAAVWGPRPCPGRPSAARAACSWSL